ncbi:hypothetical protein IKP94_01110 [Candidatus Saccharibacteria bacterium]|nr:hypothetical protein [Candidatus Saccharibacteria bacterium]MBR6964911.1 hypothetical protein [Candidatus Saccharibacteria bacterium]
MKKYDLDRGDRLIKNGKKLYRVIALKDIPRHGIKAGDKGGYIQFKKNLSQYGSAWVDERAIVMGNARVEGRALVYGDVVLTDNAIVKGDAKIGGNTAISGDTVIFGKVSIDNTVCVWKDSACGALAYASRNAELEAKYSRIEISGKTTIFDEVEITGNVIVRNSILFGKLRLYGNSSVIDCAGRIHNNGMISFRIGAYSAECLTFKKRGLIVCASTSKVKIKKVESAKADKNAITAVS